jgi:hypothetical protein
MLKQNKGAKVHSMPANRASGKAMAPKNGSKAVTFEGTHVCPDAGTGVTHPSKMDAGSHTSLERTHGGD